MESTPDQKFVDTFSAIIAGLLLFTIAIIVLAIMIANRTSGVAIKEDAQYQERINDRIRPIGDAVIKDRELTLLGQNAVESMAIAAGAVTETEIIMASFTSGQEVYDSACVACHGLGVAGAPKIGDPSQWTARVATGMETLYKNAIEGYTGDAGVMPAKGGRNDLTDDHVRLSVDYMVGQSQ